MQIVPPLKQLKINAKKNTEESSWWIVNYNCLENKHVQDDLINDKTNLIVANKRETFDLFESDPNFISKKKDLKSK